MLNKIPLAFLIILLLGWAFQPAMAQDPHYTQFYANQPMLNPAFTGAGGGPRVSMNYRAQWVAIPGSYRQMAAGYDQPVYFGKSVQGVGLLIQNDRAGEGNLSKLDVLFNYSFAVQLGGYKNEHYLRFGLSGGIQQASIDFQKLRFSDQIDPELGFIRATQEVMQPTHFSPDVGFGMTWYNKFAWLGVSVNHITQPEQTFTGYQGTEDTRLPMRITATGGIAIPAGPISDREKVVVSPSFLYMQQRNFNQLSLGSYFNIEPVVFGIWYRANFNNFTGDALASDMIAGLVGFKEGVFSVGYSYDYTISRLTNGISGGSHEIAIVIELESEKRSRFKHRRLPCPRF